MSVLIFSTTFAWKMSHSKENSVIYDQKYIGLRVKHLLFLSDFKESSNFSDIFLKKSTKIWNLMKMPPVGAELCPVRTDGRTDRHDKANSGFSTFLRSHLKTFIWNILFQSNTFIYCCQFMHIATSFDSKESSSGYSLNHIVDTSNKMQILWSQKV